MNVLSGASWPNASSFPKAVKCIHWPKYHSPAPSLSTSAHRFTAEPYVKLILAQPPYFVCVTSFFISSYCCHSQKNGSGFASHPHSDHNWPFSYWESHWVWSAESLIVLCFWMSFWKGDWKIEWAIIAT